MAATLPAISRELLYIPGIQAFDLRSPDAAADPTSLPVSVALIPPRTQPDDGDWQAAEWFDATTVRILVGPPALTETSGNLVVWLRITGATEQPERPVGPLRIT